MFHSISKLLNQSQHGLMIILDLSTKSAGK